MTDRKQALQQLRDKVAAGDEAGVREIIIGNSNTFRPSWLVCGRIMEGSLDAAMALHRAVLPGWVWILSNEGRHAGEVDGPLAAVSKSPDIDENLYQASASVPSRAWFLSILDALIAQEPD